MYILQSLLLLTIATKWDRKYSTVIRISSDKAGYFPKNKTSFYFVEIATGDIRHTQQIHIDEPSMYPCPLVRIFKTGLHVMYLLRFE